MALAIALGRGVMKAAYDPSTLPSFSELNAAMLADFKAQFGNIDLATSQLSAFSTFKASALEHQGAGNYENFAPFNGSLVRVFAASEGNYPLTWTFAGKLYALTSNGLKSIGIADLDAAVIATID